MIPCVTRVRTGCPLRQPGQKRVAAATLREGSSNAGLVEETTVTLVLSTEPSPLMM